VVIDNDLGLGFFSPISDEDREIVRQAQALHIKVSEDERDAILAVVRNHPEWHQLAPADHDMRIFNAVTMDRFPLMAPSLLDVRAVMAAVRAEHLA